MEPSWSLTIADAIGDPWLGLTPVNIGGGRLSSSADFYVLADGPRQLRFDLRFLAEDYHFREAAISWCDWFAFGFGQRTILWRDDRSVEFDMQTYFSDLVPLADCLLAVSGQGLVCLGSDGTMLWRNDDLGIDGIIVGEVADGVISGDGEWDPPGGWRPFRVSLRTGLPVS